MNLVSLAFYLFSIISVASAFMVIASRNPVYSVLFLILTFFNVAGLFVLVGAEFLAVLLVVVYVGAVAILFLFVVMMLDIDIVQMRAGFLQYMPVGATIGLILLVELILVFTTAFYTDANLVPQATPPGMSNVEALGRVLYTDYIYYFQAAGAILLVAMIGAIVLTFRYHPNPRKQNIAAQNARRRADGVKLVDVKPGDGL